MNSLTKLTSLIIFSVAFAVIAGCNKEEEDTFFIIKNSLSHARPDARITIVRDSLPESFGDLNDSSFVIQDEKKNSIPYQLDDLDGDGKWDELALLYSLDAKQEKKLYLNKSDSSAMSEFKDRASIWFAKYDSSAKKYRSIRKEVRPEGYHRKMQTPYYYQFEGPGWENDVMGFRMYFDNRNAFDIWGKTTTDMVLNQIGTGEDYHQQQPWGMDVLHVGNSLGAGAIAVIEGDSLYHLGATDKAEFKTLADGPVRAVFDLIYKGWKVGGKTYAIRERISIWGGQHGYENKVSVLTNNAKTMLAAGVVTAKLDNKPVFKKNGDPFPYVVGWGKQSENEDYLGMGVAGTSKEFEGYGQRHKNPGGVDHSAFVKFKLTSEQPVHYVFVAGWEGRNKDFAQEENFIKTVQDEGRRLNEPVSITFKK